MRLTRKKDAPQQTTRQRLRSERQQPQAFSYYSQRSNTTVNTGRQAGRDEAQTKRVDLQPFVQRAGLIVLGVALVAGVASNLMLSSSPRIVRLSPSGANYFLHSNDDYAIGISSILKASIWDSNKLSISTGSVSIKIEQKFPELSHVSVELPLLGHRPVVYLQPGQPALILNAVNGGYVLDTSGKAVVPTTQLPASAHLDLPVITDRTGLKAVSGRQALTSNDVEFIQMVVTQLKAHSINIASLTLPPAASELDVYIAGQPYFVKFNMHATAEDGRQQAGTYIAVQKKLASESITPSQYIDVRVDGRAYYQ